MEDLILNRYKPMKEAGKGGFGTVIVAWDTRMRRKVAIKQIALSERVMEQSTSKSTEIIEKPDNSQKTRSLKKSKKQEEGKSVDEAGEHWQENIPGLAEARTAAMISDANIVTVHDFELEGNNAYIIMEYVEGLTLTQFLNEYSDKMTLDMLTCIFSGISHALEVAHSENVLHLDIKPDNVLIDTKGKVKVTDFGLATLADEFGYGTANAGTIGYMPPEQMRRQALDARSDEWALASITYEMLCGVNPFDAKDVQGSLKKTEDAKLTVPSACWEDLSSGVDDAIFKALSPNMDERYSSVNEFSKDAMEHLSNPRSGQRQLSALFKEDDEDKEAEHKLGSNKSKVLDNLTDTKGLAILGRIYAAIASIPLAILSVANISFFNTSLADSTLSFNLWGYVAIVLLVISSAIWPPLGLALTSIVLSFALILAGNHILAGVLAFVSILWCVYNFKNKVSNTNTVASYPLFGCFGFSQFAPFLTGLFCDIKDSFINVIYGFVLILILSGTGSMSLIGWEPFAHLFFSYGASNYGFVQSNVLYMIQQASTWAWFVSWALAALIIALMFRTNYRVLHIAGPIIATAVTIVGICAANYLASSMSSWQPQGWEILPTIVAGTVATVISIFLPNKSYD